MNIAQISAIREECKALRLRARTARLTQQAIATAVDASQAQVSRVLAGRLKNRSRLFEEISFYVLSSTGRSKKSAVLKNDVLQDALAETWDGTKDHAHALSAVIRATAMLRPPCRRK